MKKPKSTLGIFVGKIKKTPVTLLASTSCIGEAPYLLLIGFPSSHIYYTFFFNLKLIFIRVFLVGCTDFCELFKSYVLVPDMFLFSSDYCELHVGQFDLCKF